MHITGAKVMFIEVNNEDEKYLSDHCRSMVQFSADYEHRDHSQSVSLPLTPSSPRLSSYLLAGGGLPEEDRPVPIDVRAAG